MDQINALAHILSKKHFDNKIEDYLHEILKKYISLPNGPFKMDFRVLHRDTPECAIACKIESEYNIFRNPVTIIIKPDHSDSKRVLRVFIQEGSILKQKAEDDDNLEWNDKKVFLKELHDIEKDIKDMLIQLRKQEHFAV